MMIHGDILLFINSLPGVFTYSHTLRLYHIPSRNWIEIGKNGPKPCKRSSHSAVYHENSNSFILFGGFTTDESSPGTTYLLTYILTHSPIY